MTFIHPDHDSNNVTTLDEYRGWAVQRIDFPADGGVRFMGQKLNPLWDLFTGYHQDVLRVHDAIDFIKDGPEVRAHGYLIDRHYHNDLEVFVAKAARNDIPAWTSPKVPTREAARALIDQHRCYLRDLREEESAKRGEYKGYTIKRERAGFYGEHQTTNTYVRTIPFDTRQELLDHIDRSMVSRVTAERVQDLPPVDKIPDVLPEFKRMADMGSDQKAAPYDDQKAEPPASVTTYQITVPNYQELLEAKWPEEEFRMCVVSLMLKQFKDVPIVLLFDILQELVGQLRAGRLPRTLTLSETLNVNQTPKPRAEAWLKEGLDNGFINKE